MEKVDMTYSFHHQEEPTDEQLQQLMHEACEDAKAKKEAAQKRYFQQLEEAAKVAKANFKQQYGIA
ncbi:hypothetical protein [Phocaeicola sp.]